MTTSRIAILHLDKSINYQKYGHYIIGMTLQVVQLKPYSLKNQ